MKIDFLKMHGSSNDFMIIDNRSGQVRLNEEQIRFLANRKIGVGFDQLILLDLSLAASVYMHIFNADGSAAKMCGNALRCVAGLVMDDTEEDEILIDSPTGLIKAHRNVDDTITVEIGQAIFSQVLIPISFHLDPLKIDMGIEGLPPAIALSVGNPHLIFFLEDMDQFNLDEIGPQLEKHQYFPESMNVSFTKIIEGNKIILNTWERGTGRTLACGSAASACAAAAVKLGLGSNKYPFKIFMAGGELEIEVSPLYELKMTGPYSMVYHGEIEI